MENSWFNTTLKRIRDLDRNVWHNAHTVGPDYVQCTFHHLQPVQLVKIGELEFKICGICFRTDFIDFERAKEIVQLVKCEHIGCDTRVAPKDGVCVWCRGTYCKSHIDLNCCVDCDGEVNHDRSLQGS